MKKKLSKLLSKASHKLPIGSNLETEPTDPVPRITSDTLTSHRDEVLSSARKLIYPLQHSKHKIVILSTSLFITTLVVFFAYSLFALYRFEDSSKFMYRVTQIIPFPIARSGTSFVAYENYLFELRRYTHYYTTQQELELDSESGLQQLEDFKKRALDKVVNDALIKQLARKHNVSVSDQEVNHTIDLLREQSRLGGSNKVFEDVLREFWDWSVGDFKRSLRQQLLSQKLVSTLDTDTHAKAESALIQLTNGADFAELAKTVSEDPATKDAGGEFGFMIDKTNRDVAPQTIEALYKLKPGEQSQIVNLGYALEILKVSEVSGDRIKASHIVFNFQDVAGYINELKDEQKVNLYLKL